MTYANVRKKGMTVLAWASFIVAIAGGALAADMWIGKAVGKFVHAFPLPWLAAVLLVVAFLGTVIDLCIDGEPNQLAIYAVILMPSFAAATGGGLARSVTSWSGSVLAWIDQDMSAWLGTASSTGLAVAAIASAILMSRRVVKKSKGRGGSGTPTPAMTTTTKKLVI